MAAAFCSKCGAAVPAGAQFCAACGAPVAAGPGAPAPTASSSAPGMPPPLPPPPPPVPSVPISTTLGVAGARRFLVQHLLAGPRHSYRVMDHEKRHLFSLGENIAQERQANWNSFFQPAQPGQPRFQVHLGPGPARAVSSFWGVEEPRGALVGALALETQGMRSTATLSDASGAPSLTVHVERGMASLSAQATTPDGRPALVARGGLIHHNLAIHDATGAEVAKIHESFVSARDTYAVDLVGPVDPVFAVVFAVLIDHFKGR